jgi:hypothetical protein
MTESECVPDPSDDELFEEIEAILEDRIEASVNEDWKERNRQRYTILHILRGKAFERDALFAALVIRSSRAEGDDTDPFDENFRYRFPVPCGEGFAVRYSKTREGAEVMLLEAWVIKQEGARDES